MKGGGDLQDSSSLFYSMLLCFSERLMNMDRPRNILVSLLCPCIVFRCTVTTLLFSELNLLYWIRFLFKHLFECTHCFSNHSDAHEKALIFYNDNFPREGRAARLQRESFFLLERLGLAQLGRLFAIIWWVIISFWVQWKLLLFFSCPSSQSLCAPLPCVHLLCLSSHRSSLFQWKVI